MEKRSWRNVVTAEGLTDSEENKRTLRRQSDRYAALVWRVVSNATPIGPNISTVLRERTDLQSLLRHETGLPFSSHPQQCIELVAELAPRGFEIELARITAEKAKLAGQGANK